MHVEVSVCRIGGKPSKLGVAAITHRHLSEPVVQKEVEEAGDDQYGERRKKTPQGVDERGKGNRDGYRRTPQLLREILLEIELPVVTLWTSIDRPARQEPGTGTALRFTPTVGTLMDRLARRKGVLVVARALRAKETHGEGCHGVLCCYHNASADLIMDNPLQP
jgi:hypothetical protein